jgi:hypothetical protein
LERKRLRIRKSDEEEEEDDDDEEEEEEEEEEEIIRDIPANEYYSKAILKCHSGKLFIYNEQ